jgi:hypothetical protein
MVCRQRRTIDRRLNRQPRYLAEIAVLVSPERCNDRGRDRLMAVSHWRVFTDTKKREVAEHLTAKLQSRVGRTFQDIVVYDYHKGGHVVTFNIEHDFDQWQGVAYDVIACAQQLGHGWSLSGFIDEELELISTGISVAGIAMATCFCPRPGTPNAK